MRVSPIQFNGRPPFPIVSPIFEPGGDEGIRTPDPCFAKAVLSQLSYIPFQVQSSVVSGRWSV